MKHEGRPKAFKQLLVTKRLVQERDSTGLQCSSTRFVPVSGYENDRDRVALVSEVALEL